MLDGLRKSAEFRCDPFLPVPRWEKEIANELASVLQGTLVIVIPWANPALAPEVEHRIGEISEGLLTVTAAYIRFSLSH